MKIGVVGTGRMGTAIVGRLIESGHEVRIWNRTADNARAAKAAGASWTPTLAKLVSHSQVVISFLLDNSAVESAYFGTDGLLADSVEGRVFIDMSTVSPEIRGRIARVLASRGAHFIECPVSGSIGLARMGQLVGFAGGGASDFLRAQPLLAQLCRRVDHVGPIGSGSRMKLAANLLLIVFWQALGEALLLADLPQADAAHAIDLLADSNIGAGILRARSEQIVAAMNGTELAAPAFDVDTMRKDLSYMAREATVHGVSLPLAERTLECFDRASREGKGGVDSVAYPAYLLNGQHLVADRPVMTGTAE